MGPVHRCSSEIVCAYGMPYVVSRVHVCERYESTPFVWENDVKVSELAMFDDESMRPEMVHTIHGTYESKNMHKQNWRSIIILLP